MGLTDGLVLPMQFIVRLGAYGLTATRVCALEQVYVVGVGLCD